MWGKSQNIEKKGGECHILSCFLASLTFRAALVRSSWTIYSLEKSRSVNEAREGGERTDHRE